VHSLNWKLSGALLLIVVISVGLMAYLINLNTTRQFNEYLETTSTRYAETLADNLAQFYADQQSWDGLQSQLRNLQRDRTDHIVVADTGGEIIGDTSRVWLGEDVEELELTGGWDITSDSRTVGEVFLFTEAAATGPGQGRGRQIAQPVPTAAATTPPAVATIENDFLDSVTRSLWLTALIAIAVAIVIGFFLTRQVTRPIHELGQGARHLARGDLKYRVKNKSRDEIGDLARSFNAMAGSLEASEQCRRQLIADIAHELRTPLTVIEGTMDAIQDGVFPADAERLGTIKEQTALLTMLIKDLRDLSLAEAGQLKLEKAPTDLARLLERKVEQARLNTGGKNIRFIPQIAEGLPPAHVDAARIEQVVNNLLSNAVRHTPEGGAITVSLQRAGGAASPSLQITVADTGEGIPPEHLPHIFDRFYRVAASRSRAEGGTGLGLTIVKQMVAAHGGQVRAESTVGKGSTFYATVPLGAD